MTFPYLHPCCPYPSHSQLPDLKKIEEMTLHLIEMKKEIEELKNKK